MCNAVLLQNTCSVKLSALHMHVLALLKVLCLHFRGTFEGKFQIYQRLGVKARKMKIKIKRVKMER